MDNDDRDLHFTKNDCTRREEACSLRGAIAAASNVDHDRIVLLDGTYSLESSILIYNKSLVITSEDSHLSSSTCPERFIRLCSDPDSLLLAQDSILPSSVVITMEKCVQSGNRDCTVFRVDPGHVNRFKISRVSVRNVHRLVYISPLNINENPYLDNIVALDCVYVANAYTSVVHGRLQYYASPDDIIQPGTALINATNVFVAHSNMTNRNGDQAGVFAMEQHILTAQNVTIYNVNVSSGTSDVALFHQIPMSWKRVKEYRHVLSQVNMIHCTSSHSLVTIRHGNQGLLYWDGGTVSDNTCTDTFTIGTSSDLKLLHVTFERNKLMLSDFKSTKALHPLAMIRVLDPRSETWDIEGCTFRENDAQVLVYNLALDLFRMNLCTIDGSSLTEYGCIHIINSDLSLILRSTIMRCKNTVFGNPMENGGGAVFIEGTNMVDIMYNTFQENYSQGGSGGALFVTKTCSTRLRNNVFKQNQVISGTPASLAMGGAVAVTGSTTRCKSPRLIIDDLNDETATSFIGNRITGTAESRGGALYLSSLTLEAHRFTSKHGIMERNQASYGGAIYARDVCYTHEKYHLSGLNCVENHASLAGGCIFFETIHPDDSIHRCEKNQTGLIEFLSTSGKDTSDGYGDFKATSPHSFKLINSSIDLDTGVITTVGPDTRFNFQLGAYDMLDNMIEGSLTFVASMIFNSSAEPSRQMFLQSSSGEKTKNIIDVSNVQFQATPVGTAAKMTIISPTHPSVTPFERTFIIAPCSPGSQPIYGGTQCELCAPGYHASAYGNGTCVMCPRGTRAELRGSSECESCPRWTISWLTWEGMTSPSDCTLGSAMFLLAVFLVLLFIVLGITVSLVTLAVLIRQVRVNLKQRTILQSLLMNDALEERLLEGANYSSELELKEDALLRLIPWRYIIKKQDITIGVMLASGAQASLFAGVYRGSAVALKLYRKRNLIDIDTNSMDEFIHEVRMLIALSNHPNVVQFFGICDFDSNKIAAVCELMKCSLAAYIERSLILHEADHTMCIDWKSKVLILKHIATGIFHLHQNNVCHRDIKLENILVGEDPAQVVKVADFGFSKNLNESRSRSSHTMGVGTAAYIAPELINSENAVVLQSGRTSSGRKLLSSIEQQLVDRTLKACDVYSFGILIAALLLETTNPYGSVSNVDIVYQVKARELRPVVDEDELFHRQLELEKAKSQLSDSALKQQLCSIVKLMRRCWDQQPLRRPTFEEVIHILDEAIGR